MIKKKPSILFLTLSLGHVADHLVMKENEFCVKIYLKYHLHVRVVDDTVIKTEGRQYF